MLPWQCKALDGFEIRLLWVLLELELMWPVDVQHEVRRLQQQLQATALMLEESRAQEAEARQQVST